MDYEKKYNEAIERMRKMLGPWRELAYNGKSFLQDLESIFPELRESEDEIHRKWILEYLYDGLRKADEQFKDHFKSAIEWLEKQKEPTPADGWGYADKRMSHPLYLEGFEAGRAVEREMSESAAEWSEEDEEDMKDLRNLVVAELGKYSADYYCMSPWALDSTGVSYPFHFAKLGAKWQKEQKPNIEICPHSIKSKSYKENFCPIEDCDYGLEIAFDILEKTFGEVRGYQTDDGLREHQTAIEAVRKAREQKPAEWSEEDSIMLDSILAVIEEWESNQSEKEKEYYGATPKADWLKSLRPQPKQEWSEEDERILKGIIGKIDHDQTYGVSKAEMLSFLKRLRPSWKPNGISMVEDGS